MPFVSRAQRGYLYAKKPAVAKKFAAHGGKKKPLPARKKSVRRDSLKSIFGR